MFANYIKTTLLLGVLSGILLSLGMLIGGANGLTIALVMAIIFNGIAYFYSDLLVLRMYKAQRLDENKYQHIYTMVQDLCDTMKLPMPKLWIIQTPMANAFATGRNPKNASIAVTSGILELLDTDELRGVLAHELAHVQNRDILISTIAAMMATAIGYLASMARYSAFFRSSSSDNRRNNNNTLILIAVGILAPIAATIMQLAVSRSREYGADETGAHACHDPLALAAALEKLSNQSRSTINQTEKTAYANIASLFIVNPLNAQTIRTLFSTHPPLEKRIQRLHQIHDTMF